MLAGPRQQGTVARNAERVAEVRDILAAGTDADSLLRPAVGYGHHTSHRDCRALRLIFSIRQVNSGFMIKFSSTTLCDVTCACVLPFARDGACPATFACLIGRAGAGLGLPCKHMLSRGGGLPAASAHSRHQWRRKTPVRCFSTPPLTRNGCTRDAAAAIRRPNGSIPFETPARSGSTPPFLVPEFGYYFQVPRS